jgi:hypothetical protein
MGKWGSIIFFFRSAKYTVVIDHIGVELEQPFQLLPLNGLGLGYEVFP